MCIHWQIRMCYYHKFIEAGKYTVPAKLVTDGISLEDILNALTKDLSSVTSLFDSISSGNSMLIK